MAISNPFDYHTFVWGDVPVMTDVFAAVMEDGHDLTALVLDLPREDRCDRASFRCVVEAAVVAHEDEHRLLKPRAFVVLAAGHEPGTRD